MKKKFALAILFAATSMLAVSASAQGTGSGQITFNGKLTATGCTTSNTDNTGALTVTLPTIPATTIPVVGNVAGQTFWQFTLTNCPTTGSVRLYIHNDPSVLTAAGGRLKNTATITPATNVSLQLLNSTGGVVDASQQDGSQNTSFIALTGTAATIYTLNHSVQYYAEVASPTAGNVKSVINYDLSYF